MPATDTHAAGLALNATTGRAYCGRKTKDTTKSWKAVTCVDCLPHNEPTRRPADARPN